jgi:hypothetical protein
MMINFTGKVKCHITTNSLLQQEVVLLKLIQQTSTKAVPQLHFLHQLEFDDLSANNVKPSTLLTKKHQPFLCSLAMLPLGCIDLLPECVAQISVRLSSCSSLLAQPVSFNREFVPLVGDAVLYVSTELLLSNYAE